MSFHQAVADMRQYVRRTYGAGASLLGAPIPLAGGVWAAWIRLPSGEKREIRVRHADVRRVTSNDPAKRRRLTRKHRAHRHGRVLRAVRKIRKAGFTRAMNRGWRATADGKSAISKHTRRGKAIFWDTRMQEKKFRRRSAQHLSKQKMRRRVGRPTRPGRPGRDPVHPGERLTADITIRGRMPTPMEYREHMKLLEDVDAGGSRVFHNWTGKDMSDLQHEVWVAVHRQGLVQATDGNQHRLTAYGKVYLRQRRG